VCIKQVLSGNSGDAKTGRWKSNFQRHHFQGAYGDEEFSSFDGMKNLNCKYCNGIKSDPNQEFCCGKCRIKQNEIDAMRECQYCTTGAKGNWCFELQIYACPECRQNPEFIIAKRKLFNNDGIELQEGMRVEGYFIKLGTHGYGNWHHVNIAGVLIREAPEARLKLKSYKTDKLHSLDKFSHNGKNIIDLKIIA
jgi:hypothetical protein